MQERIRADNLCKRYGSLAALDQASLVAYAGECVGVFGPSGAGKSTLLRLLAGAEAPDSGNISFADGRAGLSRQTPFIDGALTSAEALWLYAALYEIPRGKRHAAVRETLTLVGLDSERNRRIGTLPSGSQKLLEVALAVLSPSDLLLLDEPMAGLDFDTRQRVWEYVLRIRARERKTVVVATARSEDAELCDRIVLLHKGQVLAAGTVAQLRSMVGPEALVITPAKTQGTHARRGWAGIVGREQDGSLVVEMGPESRPVELLREISDDIAAVRVSPRGLDSVLQELIARQR